MMQLLTNNSLNANNIEYINSLSKQPLLKPFSNVALEFIEAISTKILLDKKSRQFPELIAMAHWLRKSHILEIKNEFNKLKENKTLVARGTALHFAPSNVDTIFMYSWILSLLVGNKNIIRLSSRGSEQIELLLVIINDVLSQEKFSSIQSRSLIIRYEHNYSFTETLSNYCDLRIIWGGDHSIRNIREIPLPTHAKEIVFADKFSLAAIHASSILISSAQEISILVSRFYNDAFWFNQLACSSPRLVIWVGKESEIQAAQQKFWCALDDYCKYRNQSIEPAIQIHRLTQVYEISAKNFLGDTEVFPLEFRDFSRIEVNDFPENIRELHKGGQLFLELKLESLFDAITYLSPKDQTLSTYGFAKQELQDLVEMLPYRAIDRIVPIGEALIFDPSWDGYSLLQELTREISIKV
jgi:hypothetical protein